MWRNENLFLLSTQASENRLHDGIHLWLIVASNFDNVVLLLNDSSYSPLTDLVIAIESAEGYELHDVYNPSKTTGGNLNTTNMGSWHKDKGLIITLTQDKFHRRLNLHGMKVRVGTVVSILFRKFIKMKQ